MSAIIEIFSYPFMVRALIVGILVSLCASLLGVSLVLKKYSMIGDGLSHVGFGAMAIATAFNAAPLVVAVPVCVIAAFLLLRLSETSKVKGDAAIAVVSSGALAVGVMVVSMTTGMNTDIYNYMFGSILALSGTDTVLCVILSVVVIAIYVVFYNRIFAVTFDEVFTRATGTPTGVYNMVLAILTAVTVVLGMRMMGALLISSLIIFPALTSMSVCRTYKKVIGMSAIISAVCFCIGLVISFGCSAPTGASIVVVNMVALSAASVCGVIKRAHS